MEIELADHMGFCYGVKRAINLARHQAGKDSRVVTLGPIIHNPQMVQQLADEGILSIDDFDEIDSGTVIIRSHGVGPAVYKKAAAKGLNIIDATCPHVKKAQMAAKSLVDEGYEVVIIGEKTHPEVKSIFEWAGENAVIIEDEVQARQFHFVKKLGIVAQTTFSGNKFKQLVNIFIDKSNDIKVLRTICTATEQRQSAAEKLAANVDMMIIIGGKNSANTTRLADLCSKKCITHHIETADELDVEWFHNIAKIGVTAGASTPDWLIREVYIKCKNKI
ncbi:4-hydroxy-3-methylbut-2-enyl diphosphate reductase [Pectinatus frisingensis]|uniref:4-hydroxy-3-methylbut-2-enyl diphosphate reductase n=1 Tax=Pectinatus frisingensis TaxID=865 RepID=UPI0018C6A418|nr:4-hydroxy-3-methylbut-2-enyl diphosphate reductase [Pectinatus frisingensis]